MKKQPNKNTASKHRTAPEEPKTQPGKKAAIPPYFSSNTCEWATPLWLFWVLDFFFRFTLDPCSRPANALCTQYYTKKQDGLKQAWRNHVVFMNPPYGRRDTGQWIERAWRAWREENATVVCLVPVRSDTAWWHKFVVDGHVIYIEKRLKFGGAKNAAPFPSALVIFGPETISFGPHKKKMSMKAALTVLPFQIALAKTLIGTPSGSDWVSAMTVSKRGLKPTQTK